MEPYSKLAKKAGKVIAIEVDPNLSFNKES